VIFVKDKKFRLRASVALVYNNENKILNLFKTNVRESLDLQINYDDIINILLQFNGKKRVIEIAKENKIDLKSLESLSIFLNKNFIFIEEDYQYDIDLLKYKYRIINFLEDYCYKTSEVINKLKILEKKSILIIGLGAVGTWMADMLARNGVKNFILVDDDVIELSNLHRQDLYFENDIGKLKIECVKERLLEIDDKINVITINKKVDDNFFVDFKYNCNFIINSADYPSVDYTTNIVGKYCMEHNIPHVIGGGYNLHLTLIGQTIIPYKTACYECFNIKLQEINKPFINKVKKLNRKNRKIGSFAPLSTIGASISSIDIFKILCGLDKYIVNDSKRIEFDIYDKDFKIIKIERNRNCNICSRENNVY
jgi:molybdopterin/thiamine biosynthesis adenylyltransferase